MRAAVAPSHARLCGKKDMVQAAHREHARCTWSPASPTATALLPRACDYAVHLRRPWPRRRRRRRCAASAPQPRVVAPLPGSAAAADGAVDDDADAAPLSFAPAASFRAHRATPALPSTLQVFACKFSCIWYLSLGAEAETIVPWWRRKYEGVTRCMLANTAAELPQLVPPPPPAARPKRPWRKKLSRQRKLQKAEARS